MSFERFRNFTCLPIATLLFFASTSKTFQLVYSTDPRVFLLGSREVEAALISFELLLACLILAGVFLKVVRCVTFALFAAFLAGSVAKIISGDQNCGCFGQTSPYVSVFLNFVALGLLCRCKPVPNFTAKKSEISYLAFCLVFVIAFLIIVIRSSRPIELNEIGDSFESNKFVAMLPEEWVGRKFVIDQFLRDPGLLIKGNWVVIFYDQGCKVCENIVGSQGFDLENNSSVALVLVRGDLSIERSRRRPHFVSQLDPSVEWYGSLPFAVTVENGKVKSVLEWNR